MREKERRYSSVLENVNLVAVGLDTDGNINFANPFLLKLTGYAQEEILGRSWFETFLPGKNKEVGERLLQEFLLKGVSPHYENSILTKSGDERLIVWDDTVLIKLRKSNGTLSNVFRPPHPPLSPDYGGEDKGEGVYRDANVCSIIYVSGFQKDTRFGHDGSFIKGEETQVSLKQLV